MAHVNNRSQSFQHSLSIEQDNTSSHQKNYCHSTMLSYYMISMIKPTFALVIFASTSASYAAILNDSSERRIQVRHSNAYISPSIRTNDNSSNSLGGDSIQGLIEQKQREYNFDAKLSIEENKSVSVRRPNQNTPSYNSPTYSSRYSTVDNTYNQFANMDFNSWANSSSYRAQEIANYQRYLNSQVGVQNVPPLEELLSTARSWNQCGYEPYQLPPQELWSNIVPTLRLYSQLKSQGILPASSQIRSVYRSPSLNACAGGARNSKHMTASAIDIWVPEYSNNLWMLSNLQDSLCQFWQYQGQSYNFGLGLYSTGAIHLDTQGYRKWGSNHASSSSSCRY